MKPDIGDTVGDVGLADGHSARNRKKVSVQNAPTTQRSQPMRCGAISVNAVRMTLLSTPFRGSNQRGDGKDDDENARRDARPLQPIFSLKPRQAWSAADAFILPAGRQSGNNPLQG